MEQAKVYKKALLTIAICCLPLWGCGNRDKIDIQGNWYSGLTPNREESTFTFYDDGDAYSLGEFGNSTYELYDENGKDMLRVEDALTQGEYEIVASNEHSLLLKPIGHGSHVCGDYYDSPFVLYDTFDYKKLCETELIKSPRSNSIVGEWTTKSVIDYQGKSYDVEDKTFVALVFENDGNAITPANPDVSHEWFNTSYKSRNYEIYCAKTEGENNIGWTTIIYDPLTDEIQLISYESYMVVTYTRLEN